MIKSPISRSFKVTRPLVFSSKVILSLRQGGQRGGGGGGGQGSGVGAGGGVMKDPPLH